MLVQSLQCLNKKKGSHDSQGNVLSRKCIKKNVVKTLTHS